MDNFEMMMQRMQGMQQEQQAPEISRETAIISLRDSFAKLQEPFNAKYGDIIETKKGVEAGVKACRGGIAIYIAKHRAGHCNESEPVPCGSTQAAMNDDIVIGVLSPDGAMVVHKVDSRFWQVASESKSN